MSSTSANKTKILAVFSAICLNGQHLSSSSAAQSCVHASGAAAARRINVKDVDLDDIWALGRMA
jgi:hypothetical protein